MEFLISALLLKLSGAPGPAPLDTLRVQDPYEQRAIEFEGYPFPVVLDRALGPSWRSRGASHQVRMKCRDGYELTIPLARVLEHRSLLAIRRTDQAAFSLVKKDVTPAKTVDLAPAYLVWENEKDHSIRAEGDYGWPFQLSEVKLEKLGSGDALPLPRQNAGAGALRGYSHFKVHCLKCHSIGGVGGKVGPELHSPQNVTSYWRPGKIEEWILNPASFRVPNGMPPLAPTHPERKRMARELVEYLKGLPPSSAGEHSAR
jgi:mono/diheme cytochrome c family protein